MRGYEIAVCAGAIGQVEDLLIDDVTWELPYVLVDTRKWQHLRRPTPVRAIRSDDRVGERTTGTSGSYYVSALA